MMMNRLYRAILLLILLLSTKTGFSQGTLIPFAPLQFTNSSGVAVSSGFLCTYAAGTTTPLSTYSDSTLLVANQNPVRLNSAGQPVLSSTLISIFVPHSAYKFNLYASGTGNTCNGTTVGALIWSRDNIINYPSTLSVGAIDLVNNAAPPASTTGHTYLYNNNSGTAKICQNGGSCADLIGSSGGVSGTTGYIPVFTAPTLVGDSRVQEDTSVPGSEVLKINERVCLNCINSDVTTGAAVSLGAFNVVNSATNAQQARLLTTGGGSGRVFLDSTHTGSGTTVAIAISFDGTEVVKITPDSFIQLTDSYAGGTLSAAGTVAIRNNAGTLEASQNGGAWAALAAGGTVTNSSTTAGTIPVMSSATNITDSMLDQIAGPFVQLTDSYAGATKSAAGTVALRNNAGALEKSENGGAWTAVAGGGTVSGTTGTFAKFTGASAVGDSSYLTENTGTGYINANSKLRVNGTTDDYGIGALTIVGGLTLVNATTNASVGTLTATGGGSGRLILNSTSTGSGSTKPISFQLDSSERMKINSDYPCMYFLGVGLRYLSISAGHVVDAGAC